MCDRTLINKLFIASIIEVLQRFPLNSFKTQNNGVVALSLALVILFRSASSILTCVKLLS